MLGTTISSEGYSALSGAGLISKCKPVLWPTVVLALVLSVFFLSSVKKRNSYLEGQRELYDQLQRSAVFLESIRFDRASLSIRFSGEIDCLLSDHEGDVVVQILLIQLFGVSTNGLTDIGAISSSLETEVGRFENGKLRFEFVGKPDFPTYAVEKILDSDIGAFVVQMEVVAGENSVSVVLPRASIDREHWVGLQMTGTHAMSALQELKNPGSALDNGFR
jgi:hypothetical protein